MIHYKKGQMMSKTAILGVALAFYGALFFFMGFINFDSSVKDSSLTFTTFHIGNIVMSIAGMGFFNIVLFGPLVGVLTWIVVSSFPTMNGGA